MANRAELYNDHTFSKKDILLLHGIDNFTLVLLRAVEQEAESCAAEPR